MDHLFVGLDVAKDHLDVHARPSGKSFVVSHAEVGLTEFVALPRPPDDPRWTESRMAHACT